MDKPYPCSICQETNHTVGKCPELYHPEKAGGGGGGGHSHDDDDEKAKIEIASYQLVQLKNAIITTQRYSKRVRFMQCVDHKL